MKDIEKNHPNEPSREATASSPVNLPTYTQPYYPSGDMTNMNTDVYSQYAYMYNYMYMQQLAMMQGGMPYLYGQYDGTTTSRGPVVNDQTNKLENMYSHSGTVASSTLDNASALVNQRGKSPKDNMNTHRMKPYARPSSAALTVPTSSVSSSSVGSYNLNLIPKNDNLTDKYKRPVSPASSVSSTNDNDSAIDLSRKGEKLQFLNTLKHIIESRDKLSDNSKPCSHKNTSGVIVPHKPEALDLSKKQVCENEETTVDSSLKSKQDKLGYITVLKELLEKGHSSTSTKILNNRQKQETVAKRENVVNIEQNDNTEVKNNIKVEITDNDSDNQLLNL